MLNFSSHKMQSDATESVLSNDWSSDIEKVLEQIRINSVILSKEHRTKYLYLKGILRYFRVPVILISSIASVSSVGLQSYIDQQLISAITCLLSLTCGIIGSIELFLAIQSRMENELMASKDYYILSIEIFKVLTLDRENRSIGGKTFLEASYSTYVKLIENSNIIDKKIADRLAHIDKTSKFIVPIPNNNQFSSSEDSLDPGNIYSPTPTSESEDDSSKSNKSNKYNFFMNHFFKKPPPTLKMSSVDDIIGINIQKKLKLEYPDMIRQNRPAHKNTTRRHLDTTRRHSDTIRRSSGEANRRNFTNMQPQLQPQPVDIIPQPQPQPVDIIPQPQLQPQPQVNMMPINMMPINMMPVNMQPINMMPVNMQTVNIPELLDDNIASDAFGLNPNNMIDMEPLNNMGPPNNIGPPNNMEPSKKNEIDLINIYN